MDVIEAIHAASHDGSPNGYTIMWYQGSGHCCRDATNVVTYLCRISQVWHRLAVQVVRRYLQSLASGLFFVLDFVLAPTA